MNPFDPSSADRYHHLNNDDYNEPVEAIELQAIDPTTSKDETDTISIHSNDSTVSQDSVDSEHHADLEMIDYHNAKIAATGLTATTALTLTPIRRDPPLTSTTGGPPVKLAAVVDPTFTMTAFNTGKVFCKDNIVRDILLNVIDCLANNPDHRGKLFKIDFGIPEGVKELNLKQIKDILNPSKGKMNDSEWDKNIHKVIDFCMQTLIDKVEIDDPSHVEMEIYTEGNENYFKFNHTYNITLKPPYNLGATYPDISLTRETYTNFSAAISPEYENKKLAAAKTAGQRAHIVASCLTPLTGKTPGPLAGRVYTLAKNCRVSFDDSVSGKSTQATFYAKGSDNFAPMQETENSLVTLIFKTTIGKPADPLSILDSPPSLNFIEAPVSPLTFIPKGVLAEKAEKIAKAANPSSLSPDEKELLLKHIDPDSLDETLRSLIAEKDYFEKASIRKYLETHTPRLVAVVKIIMDATRISDLTDRLKKVPLIDKTGKAIIFAAGKVKAILDITGISATMKAVASLPKTINKALLPLDTFESPLTEIPSVPSKLFLSDHFENLQKQLELAEKLVIPVHDPFNDPLVIDPKDETNMINFLGPNVLNKYRNPLTKEITIPSKEAKIEVLNAVQREIRSSWKFASSLKEEVEMNMSALENNRTLVINTLEAAGIPLDSYQDNKISNKVPHDPADKLKELYVIYNKELEDLQDKKAAIDTYFSNLQTYGTQNNLETIMHDIERLKGVVT